MNDNEVADAKASGEFEPDRKNDWRLSSKAFIERQ